MNNIIKFYCGFCKDGKARDRKGFRKHLKEHLKNEFFNTRISGGKGIELQPQNWVIREEFK